VQGYGLALGTRAAEYVARLLSLPAMKSWYRDALAEKFRDEAHEVEVLEVGTVLEDLRVGI
jgi:glutathione S-transferase